MRKTALGAYFLPFYLAAALVATGCSHITVSTTDSHDADMQALRDADSAWALAWSSKDLDKAVAGYADDATVLDPNLPAITGRDNFRANLKPFFADKNFAIHWDAVKVDVAQSGDLGYTRGTLTYTITDASTGQPFTDRAKYLTVWKKQPDKTWRVVEDTYNSDLPPTPPSK
jgi:ketosteroid isomerase-like protein